MLFKTEMLSFSSLTFKRSKYLFFFLVLALIVHPVMGQRFSVAMVNLPPGEVSIGEHTVSISPFLISRYEISAEIVADALNYGVTQNLYTFPNTRAKQIAALERNRFWVNLADPSSPLKWREKMVIVEKGLEKYPAVAITRRGAMKICNLLSLMDNLEECYNLQTGECYWNANGYRLPTYAEWSYAASQQSRKEDDLLKNAWFYPNFFTRGFSGRDGNYTHPVGSKLANNFGIYDLLGNVAEWSWDYFWDKDYIPESKNPKGPIIGEGRIINGGSWESKKIPNAEKVTPLEYSSNIGFRVVRNIPDYSTEDDMPLDNLDFLD